MGEGRIKNGEGEAADVRVHTLFNHSCSRIYMIEARSVTRRGKFGITSLIRLFEASDMRGIG
jgi:hypothetical protein